MVSEENFDTRIFSKSVQMLLSLIRPTFNKSDRIGGIFSHAFTEHRDRTKHGGLHLSSVSSVKTKGPEREFLCYSLMGVWREGVIQGRKLERKQR